MAGSHVYTGRVLVAENKGTIWGTVVYMTGSRLRQNCSMQARVARETETEKNRRVESPGSGVRHVEEWQGAVKDGYLELRNSLEL